MWSLSRRAFAAGGAARRPIGPVRELASTWHQLCCGGDEAIPNLGNDSSNLDWLSELCEILQDLNKIWVVFPEMMPKIMLMNSGTIRHFVILVGERQALSPTSALAIGVVVAGAGVAADLLGHRALAGLPAHLQTNFTGI